MTDGWPTQNWPGYPPGPPPSTSERLAVVSRDLAHLLDGHQVHARRLDRVEHKVDSIRQELADMRRDKETRANIKLQEKEARKNAIAAGLAFISLAMFVMAFVNFITPRLPVLTAAPSLSATAPK